MINNNLPVNGKRTRTDRITELCLIVLILFAPFAYGAVEWWGIAVLEATTAIMALLWIGAMLRRKTLEIICNPLNSFLFIFVCYALLQLFSPFENIDRAANARPIIGSLYAWATKTELLKIISYALIFNIFLATIKTKQQIVRLLSWIVAGGFVMSGCYLMRYFKVQAPRGLINPDHFSAYLGMIIPMALGLLFSGHKGFVFNQKAACRILKIEHKVLLFFSIIVMSAALFFTMSRGGIISFIFAFLCMGCLVCAKETVKRKGWILSAVAIFIILTIAWLGATPVMERASV